ncbi:hypothetical protein AMECASPLE_030149, partial [Ameca splendens]
TLSTLLLPLHQLLKTLDHLIILAHHYSTIICLTGKQLFGLSAPHPLADHSTNPLVSWFQFPCPFHYTKDSYSYSSCSTLSGTADSAEMPRRPSPQTHPPAPPGGAQGIPSSKSWAVPWASSRWDVPGTPPKEGVQEASDIDARATSTGFSRCGGAAARLRAPPGWPSSSPYL